MSVTRKTIDDVTRTLSSVTGTERLVGRDDSGDFKLLASTIYAYIKDQESSLRKRMLFT